MPPRTPKQKAATRKLVALNRRMSGGTRKRSNPRRTSTRRAPRARTPALLRGGPRARQSPLGRNIRNFGVVGAGLVGTYGSTNPAFTILAGRNLLHPTGDLRTTVRTNAATLDFRNPFTGNVQANPNVMLDVVSNLSGETVLVGQPEGFAARGRAALASATYNLRSSITPGGGIATTWGPVVGAAIAAPLIVAGSNMMADLIDTGASLIPRPRRARA